MAYRKKISGVEIEYELIVDVEEVKKDEKKITKFSDDFEPPDLADQAYEHWRDEERDKGDTVA